jgi:hypothetical protein
MRVHAEIPLASLLRLVHLGSRALSGILSRRRRIYDRRIDGIYTAIVPSGMARFRELRVLSKVSLL